MMKWQSTPRLRTLPLLWVMWWMVSQGSLLTSLLYAEWEIPQRAKELWMLDPSVWLVSGVSVLVLGSLHFGLLKSGLWQRRAVKLTATLLVTLLGAALILLAVLARNNHYRSAGMPGIYREDEYEQLANIRQYDEMARRMEEDCAFFNKAKKKMNGKIGVSSCNHGFSYLFVEMAPAWHSVIQLAPYAVLSTLENARYDNYHQPNHLGGCGEWRPVAERVRTSDTLILKALGAFMLEDMDDFASAAYQLADEDPDALALAAFASFKDPVPSRAIERMLRYQSMETFDAFPHHSRDHVKAHLINKLKSFTFQGLDNGTLDEPLKARLRELPWAKELPENYRRLLGLEE